MEFIIFQFPQLRWYTAKLGKLLVCGLEKFLYKKFAILELCHFQQYYLYLLDGLLTVKK